MAEYDEEACTLTATPALTAYLQCVTEAALSAAPQAATRVDCSADFA